MSLGILNNIAALYAENNLNSTQASLQTTLQQLSSGSRINSGADDPAGLAVSDGLGANEAALTQSSQNATDGVGLLQTADGALSQVTSLLDQAVTLATESANGTLTSGQVSSANQEYQNILSQIGNIGSTTNFNSSNVFSSTATNIVVTDGTSSGLNTYADTVGTLNTGSVGTTAAAAVTTAGITTSTTAPTVAVTNQAGVYTLTPAAASDTFAGTFSFSVGSTGTQQNITVAAGTTLTALKTQLNANSAFAANGLSAALNGGSTALVITGGTSGANATANTVTFSGTTLSDTATGTTVNGAAGTTASVGTAAKGQLTVAGAVSGDSLSGNIVLTQGTKTLTIAITSGVFGSAATSGTVENQIATALAAQTTTDFAAATEGGTAGVNPVLKFTGDNNATTGGITITNTLVDATTTSGVTYTPTGTAGTVPTPGTFAVGALGGAADTYGTGSSLTVNGTAVSLAGLNGTAAALAISSNSTLLSAGITAAFSLSTKQLTITGAASGAALTVTGATSGSSTLTDVSSTVNPDITTITTTTAAVGSAAQGGSTAIALSGANDTVSGALALTVGTSGLAKDTLSLTVAANTTGAQLASQINQNASFQTAGVSAAYNATNFTVTLTGPTGNALSTTGTALTDSSSALPGAGANFTTSGVSTLTASTASTILTTVTAAVADVAYQRGTIGADVNELTSASNVASAEEVNLTSAQDSVTATDYGQAASNLSKYQILSQTGISALAQANSVQQEVLKLLQ
jgi:flagellin